MLWRAAELMAITFVMTGSRWCRLCGLSLAKLLISQRFRTSARKGKNGFVPERIVSSHGLRRNIHGKNASDFNKAKIGGDGPRLPGHQRVQAGTPQPRIPVLLWAGPQPAPTTHRCGY